MNIQQLGNIRQKWANPCLHRIEKKDELAKEMSLEILNNQRWWTSELFGINAGIQSRKKSQAKSSQDNYLLLQVALPPKQQLSWFNLLKSKNNLLDVDINTLIFAMLDFLYHEPWLMFVCACAHAHTHTQFVSQRVPRHGNSKWKQPERAPSEWRMLGLPALLGGGSGNLQSQTLHSEPL